MQEIWNFLSVVIPTKGERVLMLISGVLGGWLSVALGGFDLSIKWLFIFVLVDYITGSAAAFKSAEWNSSTGFKGLFKKFFIFFIVTLCHGIDEVMHVDILRNAAIMAYTVNEAGSIIENFDNLGYDKYIPAVLRRGLRVLKQKQDELFKEDDTKND
jgi:toxin secretion/phage lysis holin